MNNVSMTKALVVANNIFGKDTKTLKIKCEKNRYSEFGMPTKGDKNNFTFYIIVKTKNVENIAKGIRNGGVIDVSGRLADWTENYQDGSKEKFPAIYVDDTSGTLEFGNYGNTAKPATAAPASNNAAAPAPAKKEEAKTEAQPEEKKEAPAAPVAAAPAVDTPAEEEDDDSVGIPASAFGADDDDEEDLPF